MNIAISILTWNSIQDVKKLANSLEYDFKFLNLDNNVFINVCDNGSNDGTIDFFKKKCPLPVNLIEMGENKGISISKNILIEKSIDSDYMFMFDSDVAIIPGSLIGMVKFMNKNSSVGCFGQHIDFYTKDIDSEKILSKFPDINYLKISYNNKSGCGAVRAWTHYSIYRSEIFRKGIRFDTNGPFGFPGYGFDDDDLGQQIHNEGYDIACFEELYCYHNINSSVNRLNDEGNLNFNKRKEFFFSKWGALNDK